MRTSLTFQVPLRSDVRWKKLPGDPDYWSNMLYMGEASSESDLAWNELIRSEYGLVVWKGIPAKVHPGHGFRVVGNEAERLNLTSSLPLENGGVSASLGVDHHLHCLVGDAKQSGCQRLTAFRSGT